MGSSSVAVQRSACSPASRRPRTCAPQLMTDD